MKHLAIIALVGCNQVYGLDETRLPGDIGCPALGEALVVGTKLRQISTEVCYGYAISADADRSIAHCKVGPGEYVFKVGEIGGRLDTVAFPPSPAFPLGKQIGAQLTPDGNEAWLAIDLGMANVSTQSVYRRSGSRWTWQYDEPFIPSRLTFVTAPTRGPSRHILVDDQYGSELITEFVEQAQGTWVERRHSDATSLGLNYFEYPSLSADGLRLLVRGDATDGTLGWYYTDRATIDDPFGPARFVPGIPPESESLQLSEDCTRLYFPALDSVFYLGQRD